MFKKILKKTLDGIGMGSTLLCLNLLLATLSPSNAYFQMLTDDFSRQFLSFILVSIAFNVLAIAYDYDQLSMWLKVCIHMGGGLILFFPIAFYVGWIPMTAGIGTILLASLIAICISFTIWAGYLLYYRYEAKKINAQIKRINASKF